jgi:hypothetical protein
MKTSQIDAAMEMLRSAGRNGDTELAHVNPREKAILKALGGAGSRNPRTGLREYFADIDGGMGGGAEQSSGGNVGGGSPANDTATYGEGVGVTSVEGYGPTTPQGSEIGLSGGDYSLGERASALLDRTVMNPDAIPFGGLVGQVVGRSMSAMNRAAREAFGDESVIDPGGARPGRSPEQAAREQAAYEAGFPGNRAGGDGLAMALGAVPVSAPTPRYLRGGEMAAPQEISSFIGPGMTDLQQRALISTYGTQGVNSAFRTDPVRRYYANLLSRGLISDAGAPVQNPYVLPIEQQYASQVLGRPMTNPSDAAAAYESIRGLL